MTCLITNEWYLDPCMARDTQPRHDTRYQYHILDIGMINMILDLYMIHDNWLVHYTLSFRYELYEHMMHDKYDKSWDIMTGLLSWIF